MADPLRVANKYEDVDTLSSDGVYARITRRRRSNGVTQYSYDIFRQYDIDGKTRVTHWFDPRHVAAVSRLLDQVSQRIALEKERERPSS